MQRRSREKNEAEEGDPVVSWFGCALGPEITVMAAEGLWQDLREGLGQAEVICSDLLADQTRSARCGDIRRRMSSTDIPVPSRWNTWRGGEDV